MQTASPRNAAIATILAFALAACADGPLPTAPSPRADVAAPLAVSSPAASQPALGSFTFLPPVAAMTAVSGMFDEARQPTVEVCQLASTTDAAAPCGTVVGRFVRGLAAGHGVIRVDPLDQLYHANWDTGTCLGVPCAASPGLYRIRVTEGALEYGAVVVRLVSAKARPDAGPERAVTTGSTLPIKFRIMAAPPPPPPVSVPTWSTLVASGVAASGAASYTEYAPSDQAVFATIGGGDYQPYALWRFDLTTDVWTLVPTTGAPLGKYRRIVHDAVHHQILTYWDGLGQVYAVNEAGGAWAPVGSAANDDRWYEGAAFWNPQTQRLSLFGGYGFGSWRNTLWSFDRTTDMWGLDTQGTLKPDPRFAVSHAVDETGRILYVGGGQGHPSGNQAQGTIVYDDLWALDLQTNAWSQLLPHDATSTPRYAAGMDAVPTDHALYRFGGMGGVNVNNVLTALERLDLSAAIPAWQPFSAAGTTPSARWSPGVYHDAPRHRLVVIGGSTTAGAALDAYALSLP